MTAVSTAHRVVAWACACCAQSSPEPPPTGDLEHAHQLSRPDPENSAALARLGARIAAHFRFSGDDDDWFGATGQNQILLAVAVGAEDSAAAARLASTLPPPANIGQALIRHGLVAPALPFVDEARRVALIEASPWTALVESPAENQGSTLMVVAEAYLLKAQTRRLLCRVLAAPAQSPRVRRWRADLLDHLRRLGPSGEAFVIDVYESALILHEATFRAEVSDAFKTFNASQVSDEAVENASAIAAWWRPLWALEREKGLGAFADRPHLGYGFREGLRLYGLTRKWLGGVA